MFLGRPSVPPCVRDSRGSFMFPQYLQYLLTDFRQTFVTGASRDRHELIRFWGQKVKVQGHTIAAEAHSRRRVQLFLVTTAASSMQLFCKLLKTCIASMYCRGPHNCNTTAIQEKILALQ